MLTTIFNACVELASLAVIVVIGALIGCVLLDVVTILLG